MTDELEKYILYVGGLAEAVNKQILHAAFVPFGEVKSVDIPYDVTTCKYIIYILVKPKGFGFVEFEEYEDCLHAIENMNDSELCGKVISVSFAKKKKIKDNLNNNKPIWADEDYTSKYPATYTEDKISEKPFE